MAELFLPVLSHFENENAWLASIGRMRYKVTPEGTQLRAEIWQDPWCYALSRVEDTGVFPLDESGVEAMRTWLTGWAERMEQRPAETLAETIARRAVVPPEPGENP